MEKDDQRKKFHKLMHKCNSSIIKFPKYKWIKKFGFLLTRQQVCGVFLNPMIYYFVNFLKF